ncbi:MAG: hypothetical protein OXI46_05850 [Gemmatimonadota bacterium]|nr:hypothetical protein [Gemmatimonadota bacterium]
MVTREDLESFLLRMEDLEVDEIEEGMYLVRNRGGGPPVVVSHSAPLLLLRMKVMDLPEDGIANAELFRALLELNATDVVHGAYGLEEGELILSDTLKLETLDFEELRDSLESIQLAAADHMQRIRSLAGLGTGSAGGDR